MVIERIFAQILHHEKLSIKHVFALFSFIFVWWAFYRYFPELLPVWAEELILKPLAWLLPTFWLVRKVENEPLSSLGLTRKNWQPAVFWGVGLGLVFVFEGLLVNIIKNRGLQLAEFGFSGFAFLGAIVLSLATAFSEELVFRGYIFNRLWRIWKKEWLANFVSAFLFVLIHLPISVFTLSYTPTVMLAYLFLVFVFGFASAFVFARTENLVSSILLHAFWAWPIVLFQ